MANKSERRRIEQALPFIQLYLIIKGGAITNSEERLPEIEKHIEEILDEQDQKKRTKLDNRIARLNHDSGITDLIRSGANGHKFILIIYFLTATIDKATGTIFSPKLEYIFQHFLDAESRANKTDGEVEKLRKSGQKQGAKLLQKLKELGYYND